MRPAILVLAPVLTSCIQSNATADAALSRQLADRVPGAAQTCISTVSNGNLTAIDTSTLVYQSGTTLFVNHPSAPCSAIAPLSTLIVDAQGGHYCRGDRVRGVEYGSGIPGPVCLLGDWVPYRH
jgi:hypothetical protein